MRNNCLKILSEKNNQKAELRASELVSLVKLKKLARKTPIERSRYLRFHFSKKKEANFIEIL